MHTASEKSAHPSTPSSTQRRMMEYELVFKAELLRAKKKEYAKKSILEQARALRELRVHNDDAKARMHLKRQIVFDQLAQLYESVAEGLDAAGLNLEANSEIQGVVEVMSDGTATIAEAVRPDTIETQTVTLSDFKKACETLAVMSKTVQSSLTEGQYEPEKQVAQEITALRMRFGLALTNSDEELQMRLNRLRTSKNQS